MQFVSLCASDFCVSQMSRSWIAKKDEKKHVHSLGRMMWRSKTMPCSRCFALDQLGDLPRGCLEIF